MIGMAKSAKDPMAAINQMAGQDPRMQQVMQFIQQNGGDPKTAFYALAQQKGVNPEEVLSQLRGL